MKKRREVEKAEKATPQNGRIAPAPWQLVYAKTWLEPDRSDPTGKVDPTTCRLVSSTTSRLDVPGGWLYRVSTRAGQDCAEALVFVPYGA